MNVETNKWNLSVLRMQAHWQQYGRTVCTNDSAIVYVNKYDVFVFYVLHNIEPHFIAV